MDEKINNFVSSYYPPNISALTNEWKHGAVVGEPSGVSALDKILKWVRGHQNGWYGWPGDGKGQFTNNLCVTKSKRDGWKWGMFKQEDMSSFRDKSGKVHITASDIYNDLVWTLTGVTPYKHIAELYHVPQLTLDQYHEAMEWIEQHFFIIYPKDRRFTNMLDNFTWLYEVHGVSGVWIDPAKGIVLDAMKDTKDVVLNETFVQSKDFAMQNNLSFNWISHAGKLEGGDKEKDGSYKVINAHQQLGGSAWDISMDSQFTVYRIDRHKNPNSPDVMLRTLKVKKQQIAGFRKGEYDKITFDIKTNRYYFDGVCPIDGSYSVAKAKEMMSGVQGEAFDQRKAEERAKDPSWVPF